MRAMNPLPLCAAENEPALVIGALLLIVGALLAVRHRSEGRLRPADSSGSIWWPIALLGGGVALIGVPIAACSLASA